MDHQVGNSVLIKCQVKASALQVVSPTSATGEVALNIRAAGAPVKPRRL